MPDHTNRPINARAAAAVSLSNAAKRFPDLPAVGLEVTGLPPRDAALAIAIHRTTLQRWITLEFLLDRVLDKPLHTMEPPMQGVLLTGATQLIFMQRLPAHAVVDEQVNLARHMVRSGAAGMVNAVLRKVADMVKAVDLDTPWKPARDRLPLDGGCVLLNEPILPPIEFTARHLAVATSHPRAVINRWSQPHGKQRVIDFCQHGTETPPVIVAVEQGFDADMTELYQPHATPGFLVWRGDQPALRDFIDQHPDRRVQDPASALPVLSTEGLTFKRALDYCAGRGTKTRQLAALHPNATIAATDVDGERRAALERSTRAMKNVIVVGPDSQPRDKIDLLLLDVPCSNTAVLARRPEARYRFDSKSFNSLITLQREIMRQTIDWVAPGGVILYSTCSLEREENRGQADWLSQLIRGRVERDHQALPSGRGVTYQDGGYHALIRMPG
jgi:16S rRNA (cytosine967-C5)-methyltransferase